MPVDLDLVRGGRFKPEPPTPEETTAISRLDKVDYSIYTMRVELACRESREVLQKLGISTLIRAGDTAHGVYTANGDLSIAEVGTYLHVVTGIIPIKFVLKHYVNDPMVGVNDGDIFFCNEAIYGGIHNPDMITFMPVYAEGRIIAWVASASHEPETGATEPGGMPSTAKSRYDEGLKVPPIKIGEQFRLKSDIVELFENNVRYPLMMTNDLAARVASCLTLRKRILEIVEKKGVEFILGTLRKMIIDTAESVKERISKIPDGTYRHVAFLDTVGLGEGLLRLPISLTKKKDRIVFDLTHASPQAPGPYNSFEHTVEAVFASLVFQYLLSDVPASSGCLVPFEFKTTPGSCLNARQDAAVSHVVYLLPVVISALQILFIKALYNVPEYRKEEYVALPLNGGLRAMGVSGKNQWGKEVTTHLIAIGNSRGGGARFDKDGVDSAGFWYCGYAEAADCEQDESAYPVVTVWRSFAPDGGGPGKYRGGTGVSFGYMIHNSETVSLTTIGVGQRFPVSHGVFGGYPAGTRPVVIVDDSRSLFSGDTKVPSSDTSLMERIRGHAGTRIQPNSNPTRAIHDGGLVAQSSGGGGGYGDPIDRDPNSVLKDVESGRVSKWAAENVYMVIFQQNSLEIDEKATEARRNMKRLERRKMGMSFEEFEKEWGKLKPPETALNFYGEWPVPFPR